MKDDMKLVHLRIPKRLIDQLDHYAIDRNLYRAEALSEVLEEKFGPKYFLDVSKMSGSDAALLLDSLKENPE